MYFLISSFTNGATAAGRVCKSPLAKAITDLPIELAPAVAKAVTTMTHFKALISLLCSERRDGLVNKCPR